MRTGRLDTDNILVLHEDPAWDREQKSEPSRSKNPIIRVSDYLPYRVTLEVDTPRRGFVFLSDAFFPGWRAYLDGRPARMMRSWVAFRAVPVRQGRFRLEFRYEPTALRLCVLLGIAVILCWAAFYLRRIFRRAEEFPKEDSLGGCARITELFLMAMIVPWMLYWLIWGLFIYKGGL